MSLLAELLVDVVESPTHASPVQKTSAWLSTRCKKPNQGLLAACNTLASILSSFVLKSIYPIRFYSCEFNLWFKNRYYYRRGASDRKTPSRAPAFLLLTSSPTMW